MSIKHHIADDLIMAYAAGDLDEGLSLAVATHLALCAECRARVREAESIGGALLESIAPVNVSTGALQSVLSRIDETPQIVRPPKPSVQPSSDIIIPEPLRSYVGGDVDALEWRSLGRGAYHIPIHKGETSARLLRIPAGKPVPDHGHTGRELTVVLSGSFHDDRGVFFRGDVEDCDDSVHHQPIAGEGEDCICLAVTEAPLRFKSLAARLAQPFIGI
ncbi:MAG: ChrR family anti-sigma-E factor [Pseudomonadota bacterium]